jgi:hypothetical protein
MTAFPNFSAARPTERRHDHDPQRQAPELAATPGALRTSGRVFAGPIAIETQQ